MKSTTALDDPDQTWLLAANWIPAEGGGWNNAIIVAWLVAFLAAICRAALQDYSRNRLMESLEGTRRQRRFSRYLEREELIEAALTLVLVVAEIWFVWAIPGLLAFGAEQAVFGEPHSLERRSWGFLFGLLVLLPTVHALPGAVAGRGNGEAVLRATLPISYWLSLLLVPLVYPLLLLPAGSRLFHKKPVDRETEKDLVTDEIIDAVEEGERAGALEGQEAQMIERVLSLQERSVSEVMTPRTDLTSISIQSSVIEACRMAHEEGHSKIPVYKKNRDEIAGIFHLRDAIPFLSNGKSPPPLEKLLREAYFVPETKKVTQLLREFQSEEQSLAIILDEYGGTAGVITVEDILEEIVGELREKHDREDTTPIQRIDPNVASLDPRLRIEEVNEELGVKLPESEDYDTLGGFIFSHLDRIPEVDEVFHYDNLEFRILKIEARRMSRVLLRILETQ